MFSPQNRRQTKLAPIDALICPLNARNARPITSLAANSARHSDAAEVKFSLNFAYKLKQSRCFFHRLKVKKIEDIARFFSGETC